MHPVDPASSESRYGAQLHLLFESFARDLKTRVSGSLRFLVFPCFRTVPEGSRAGIDRACTIGALT